MMADNDDRAFFGHDGDCVGVEWVYGCCAAGVDWVYEVDEDELGVQGCVCFWVGGGGIFGVGVGGRALCFSEVGGVGWAGQGVAEGGGEGG